VGKKLMLLKKKIEGKKKWKFESRKENQLSSNTLVPGSLLFDFVLLWDSANEAAAPATKEVFNIFDGVSVSRQVKSYMRQRLSLHETSVTPSGHFPSPRSRLHGSRATGVSASLKALAIISLMAECIEWRPALLRQDSPWKP